MITSYSRGYKIIYINDGVWIYEDDGTIFDDSRPCRNCGEFPLKTGEDYCLGHLKGIRNACCGHGIKGEEYKE